MQIGLGVRKQPYHLSMFRNFFILAYRHFVRSPLTSFIELAGMTAGLTIFILVLIWVTNELSYDQFNENADRIYRLDYIDENTERQLHLYSIEGPLLKQNLTEIQEYTRFRFNVPAHQISRFDKDGVKKYYEGAALIYTDNSIFQIFSFEFIAGDPKTALEAKNSIVLTESLAKQIFKENDPIGQQFYTPNSTTELFTVTAIIKDVSKFHIPFKMLYSFNYLDSEQGELKNDLDSWKTPFYPTYVMVKEKIDEKILEREVEDVLSAHRPNNLSGVPSNHHNYQLTPLKKIYLDPITINGFYLQGDWKKISLFGTIALITLLLATINFINLNSARSLERIREVGIKKISGASRTSIFLQFFGEVLMLCIISLILALIFSDSLLPLFNLLMNNSLSIDNLLHPVTISILITGMLLVSLASGGLPSLYISSLQPVQSIKGLTNKIGKKVRLRKLNLIIQFMATIILLFGTITIIRQINYMKNAELGFNKEQLIFFRFDAGLYPAKSDIAKHQLLKHPNILGASHTVATPGNNTIENIPSEIIIQNVRHNFRVDIIDNDYLEVMDLELIEGRFLEKNRPGDYVDYPLYTSLEKPMNVVINETGAKTLGLSNVIGATGEIPLFNFGRKNIKIIGVIKDFHANSLNHQIHPMVYFWNTWQFQMILKITPKNINETLYYVTTEMEKITKEKVEIKFLDQEFDNQYQSDDNFAELVGYLTIVAIIIGLMGLLGVSTHAIKLRIKEIGIRKTMGASALQILVLLVRPFVKLLLISAILALPVAWIIMEEWLRNYAYRIELNGGIVAISCGLTVFIALITIFWQSWHASNLNPARLIRYE